MRFSDKERHLLFVEPDGTETSEVYLQGFSSSLPPYLQDDMIRTLPGFERAVVQRYAYAVEYDALDPTQLSATLMSKQLVGLFSAGQINGTSGYEEAALQGLLAGVNAARHAGNEELVTLRRDQGYSGVLIDDLVRWGIDEPYRMLTSRNEYRLLHRQDNALKRLSPTGHAWGLVSKETLADVERSEARVLAEVKRLAETRHEGTPADKLLCRPELSYEDVVGLVGEPQDTLSAEEKKRVEISVKYRAYIERSRKELELRSTYEALNLTKVDFDTVASLSSEGKEKLHKARPATLAALQRLRGIRDSDITALLIHLKAQDVSRETSAH